MLTEVALDCGVRRFLFASSCSVYGASESFSDETATVNPLSMYAEMKVESERILLGARSATFAPTILRLSTLFGLSLRNAIRSGGELVCGAGSFSAKHYDFEWGTVATIDAC